MELVENAIPTPAKATPATFATVRANKVSSVASVATVAVATTETEHSAPRLMLAIEKLIRSMTRRIYFSCDEQGIVDEILDIL